MTKKEKALILNKVVGIPTTVINNSTVEEIDAFIERNDLQKWFTEETLAVCTADAKFNKMMGWRI